MLAALLIGVNIGMRRSGVGHMDTTVGHQDGRSDTTAGPQDEEMETSVGPQGGLKDGSVGFKNGMVDVQLSCVGRLENTMGESKPHAEAKTR